MATSALTQPMIADLVRATARHGAGPEAYAAFDRVVERLYRRKLFTVLRRAPGTDEVERLFSSDTASYAPVGRKTRTGTVWGREVYDAGRVLISADPAAIERNFPDHATILGLGIGGMINMPLTWAGLVIGSMNISGEASAFSEADIPDLEVLAGLLLPLVLGASLPERPWR